jgi:hypothetical protein
MLCLLTSKKRKEESRKRKQEKRRRKIFTFFSLPSNTYFCSGTFEFKEGSLTLTNTTLQNLLLGIMYLEGTGIVDGGQAAIVNWGNLFKTEDFATTLGIPFTNNGTYHIQNGSVIVSELFTCYGSVKLGADTSLVSIYFSGYKRERKEREKKRKR